MFSAISQQSQFLLRLLFFLGLHCEFTDTNIIGVDALQGSNFYKKQTLLQQSGRPRFITPEECKDECSARPSCIGYASHPSNICFITYDHEMISSWTTQTYLSYTCYKKD